jgi:hypothetical protein
VIIRYPSYYALKAAPTDGGLQQYKKQITEICFSVILNSWERSSLENSFSSQVSELCADELLFCRLTITGSVIVSLLLERL